MAMNREQQSRPPAHTSRLPRAAVFRAGLAGAAGGLAWAGGMRAYMAELAGAESRYTWVGTLGSLVVPAVVVGALLGWSWELRHRGRPGRRWLALSPLLLSIAPLAAPGALATLFSTGLGGGAIAVPLIGMAGAYALKRQGRGWLRVACGVPALSLMLLCALVTSSIGGSDLAVTTPHGAMVALHIFALLAVLAMAASLPLQPVGDRAVRPDAAASRPAGANAAGE